MADKPPVAGDRGQRQKKSAGGEQKHHRDRGRGWPVEQHAYLEWLRLPGDVAVIVGTLPLVYLTGKSVFRMRRQPVAPELAPVGGDGPLYTEVTAGSPG